MTAGAALSREPGSQEQRFDGEAAWGARGFRAPASSGGSGPRGSFGSRRSRKPGLRARNAGQRPSGRRPARFKGGSFGGFRRAGATPAIVRGRRTLPGAIRPAPEAGLPCSSWLSEGRCRSRFDPHLSGKDGFPSPCRGAGRSGTARPPRWDGAKVSPAKEGARQGADPDRVPPARGGFGGLERLPVRLRATDRSDGILRDPARAPERPGRSPRKGSAFTGERRDRMSESGSGCRQALPGGFAPPRGRSAISLRSYRSRQARYPRAIADQEPLRRRNHAELDPALEASGECPLFRDTPQSGETPSATRRLTH